jgi:hypothetical protein
MLRDHSDAEDAVQEMGLARSLTEYGQLCGGQCCPLRSIARQPVLDESSLRRQHRRSPHGASIYLEVSDRKAKDRPDRPREHDRPVYPFERFSDDAKRALTLGQAEAQRSHHSYIGTEHLLLGVLQVDEGLGVRMLAELGIDLKAVRTKLASMTPGKRNIIQQIIPTSRVKRVIELSFDEAKRTGADEVTTGHMVVGLLLEGEGKAAQVLKEKGATVDDVREFLAVLTEAAGDTVGEPPRTIDMEAVQRIVTTAEREAADYGSRVVGSDNLLRALISRDAFVPGVLRRLGLDMVELEGWLTPPPEAQALSEAVQLARAARRDAAAKRDYPRAAAERRREKELTRELDERLRAWRQTFQ